MSQRHPRRPWWSKAPADDVPGIVIQDRGQDIPAPAQHPEVDKVGLPQPIDRAGWVLERFRGAYHHELGPGDLLMALENTIDTGFRDKVVMGVGDVPGQFSRRQVRTLKRYCQNQLPDRVGNSVPVLADRTAFILETIQAILLIGPIPAVETTSANLYLS